MSHEHQAAPLTGGTALLERAISYTLVSLHLVTPAALPYPTPCQGWDLRALLRHMNDSLSALHEATDTKHLTLDMHDDDSDPPVEIVATLKNRACQLLGARTNTDGRDVISVAGCPLTASIVTGTGAIEIAVHGWDVAQACGHTRPIPPSLAEEMLELAPLFVTDADRPTRFAAPADVSSVAGSSDRLLAFLGRRS